MSKDRRNMCDLCATCEDNDKSICNCFEICMAPIEIIEAVEKKRNQELQGEEHGTLD